MPERTARHYMRLAKNRKVIEASDVVDLTINGAVRLLAPAKDDDEKLGDRLQEATAEVQILQAQLENDRAKIRKLLLEVRTMLGDERI